MFYEDTGFALVFMVFTGLALALSQNDPHPLHPVQALTHPLHPSQLEPHVLEQFTEQSVPHPMHPLQPVHSVSQPLHPLQS